MGTEYYLCCDECKIKTHLCRKYSKKERITTHGVANFFAMHIHGHCCFSGYRIDDDTCMDEETSSYLDVSEYDKEMDPYEQMDKIKQDAREAVENYKVWREQNFQEKEQKRKKEKSQQSKQQVLDVLKALKDHEESNKTKGAI